jgi:hypothetical protein
MQIAWTCDSEHASDKTVYQLLRLCHQCGRVTIWDSMLADVQLHTANSSAGGDVCLQRLAGNNLLVSTGGGEASVTAIYGDSLELDTLGGTVAISQMNCTKPGASIWSQGGSVTVSGVDGCADILTGGGDVDIQVCCNLCTPGCAHMVSVCLTRVLWR